MGAGQSDVDQSDDAGTGQGEQDAVGDDAAQTEAPKNGLGVGETPVQAEGLWLFVPSLAAFGTWQYRFIDWFENLGFLNAIGEPTKAANDSAEFASRSDVRGRGDD